MQNIRGGELPEAEAFITSKMRVCICLGGVIARNYFFLYKESNSKERSHLSKKFMNVEIALNFKAIEFRVTHNRFMG
jgi:hypothetical protein